MYFISTLFTLLLRLQQVHTSVQQTHVIHQPHSIRNNWSSSLVEEMDGWKASLKIKCVLYSCRFFPIPLLLDFIRYDMREIEDDHLQEDWFLQTNCYCFKCRNGFCGIYSSSLTSPIKIQSTFREVELNTKVAAAEVEDCDYWNARWD